MACNACMAKTAMVVVLGVGLAAGWIGMHRSSHQPAPQTAATRAVGLCEQAVRQHATHPASIDFKRFGTQPPTRMKDGSYQDSLDFVEKDSLGDAIAKMAICTVKNGKLQSFEEPKL